MLSDRRIKREFKRLFMKEFKKEPEEEVYKFGEEFRKIEEIYKSLFDLAEHKFKYLNKFERYSESCDKSPLIRCTFLEDKGIYQYTINESAVIQKSFERYNLLKNYLEKQEQQYKIDII